MFWLYLALSFKLRVLLDDTLAGSERSTFCLLKIVCHYEAFIGGFLGDGPPQS